MSSTAYTVDVEKLVRDGLASLLGAGVRVVTETPADLASVVPLVRPVVTSGFGRYTLDRVTVVVHSFTAGDQTNPRRDDARNLAIQIKDAMTWELPGMVLDGGTVTNVGLIGFPSVIAYDNPNVQHAVGTYLLSVIPSR